MKTFHPLLLLACFLLTSVQQRAGAEGVSASQIRAAVKRSLPLLQATLQEYPNHAACFSCHHQGVGLFTLALARSKGFPVEKQSLEPIVKHTVADLRSALELYASGKGQPGGVTRAGYALLALEAGGYPKDALSNAVSGYLLQRGKAQSFWHDPSNRPPSEVSPFTDTFLAIRALKAYAEEGREKEAAKRIESAAVWLETTPTKETEDRVFQLWGLYEAGASKKTLKQFASMLLETQNADGGWAQLPDAASDAYATGTALAVLLMTGEATAAHPKCEKAARYLLKSQLADGSWRVASRSKPFQPYFESGFPHGTNQFISVAASGWATCALILASPAAKAPTR